MYSQNTPFTHLPRVGDTLNYDLCTTDNSVLNHAYHATDEMLNSVYSSPFRLLAYYTTLTCSLNILFHFCSDEGYQLRCAMMAGYVDSIQRHCDNVK